jgi:hypothetical protein
MKARLTTAQNPPAVNEEKGEDVRMERKGALKLERWGETQGGKFKFQRWSLCGGRAKP